MGWVRVFAPAITDYEQDGLGHGLTRQRAKRAGGKGKEDLLTLFDLEILHLWLIRPLLGRRPDEVAEDISYKFRESVPPVKPHVRIAVRVWVCGVELARTVID